MDFAAAGGGRTLKRAAKNNLDFDNQMIINFGRIFRYYENDTENIRINCTQRSLARADNPFSNQKVPEEYLYVPIDAIVIHKEKLIEMLNWRFLTPEHKMAIEYGIECIEKCNKD